MLATLGGLMLNSSVSRKKKQCLLTWNFSVICIIRVFLSNFFIQHGIFSPAPWYATTYQLLLFRFADVYWCWKKHNLCVWWSCTHKVGKKEKKSLYIKRFIAVKAERICLFFLHIFIRRAKSSSFFFSSSGDERAQETLFSGLYSYNCQTNTWNKLK